MYVGGSIGRKRSVRQFNTAGFQFKCTSHNVRTELNDALLFMNIKSHHTRVNSNCVKMVGKLMDSLKEFVAAINVEPAWLLYFVGIGMFYMPSQVPISHILNDFFYNCINTKELYLEKTCKVNLNHSSGICENLANHSTIKIEVQKEVAGIQVIKNTAR